jgi:hypothetical protein
MANFYCAGEARRDRIVRQAKKKGPVLADWSRILVRLAGIEPTTPWFVAKYSIQLSYSREGMIIAGVPAIAKRPGGALVQFTGNEKRDQVFQPGPSYSWCGWQESNPRPLGS